MLSREQGFRGTVDVSRYPSESTSKGQSGPQRVLIQSMSTPGSARVDPCEIGAHLLCWK